MIFSIAQLCSNWVKKCIYFFYNLDHDVCSNILNVFFQSKFNLRASARKLNFVNLDHDVCSNIPLTFFQSKFNLRAYARKLNFVKAPIVSPTLSGPTIDPIGTPTNVFGA